MSYEHDLTTFCDSASIAASSARSEAFGVLFERHYEAVRSYCVRRLGVSDGEDAAAEVFLRAYDARGSYRVDYADARPWLLGIATNVMRRHWRTEARRLRALARAKVPSAASFEASSADDAVLLAVAGLEERARESLLLYAWGELSYDEIAVALRIPVGTVRSRLARAPRTVRAALCTEQDMECPSKEVIDA